MLLLVKIFQRDILLSTLDSLEIMIGTWYQICACDRDIRTICNPGFGDHIRDN